MKFGWTSAEAQATSARNARAAGERVPSWKVAVVFGIASIPLSSLGARTALAVTPARLERRYGRGYSASGRCSSSCADPAASTCGPGSGSATAVAFSRAATSARDDGPRTK